MSRGERQLTGDEVKINKLRTGPPKCKQTTYSFLQTQFKIQKMCSFNN